MHENESEINEIVLWLLIPKNDATRCEKFEHKAKKLYQCLP